MSSNRLHFFAKIGAAAIVISGFGLMGCDENNEAAPENTLKIFIPSEYMSESLVPNFENKFNAKVIVEEFESNEEMFAKVQAGDKYDVLIPSDYMIERLLSKKMLQPIDKEAMTNIGELTDAVKNLNFDPNNNYSIPYFWGNVGIVYNKNTISPETVKEQGYSIFHNTDFAGRIYWYDSERDSFMVALKVLNYSMNTDKESEIEAAFNWLMEMKTTMNPDIKTSEVILEEMSKENAPKDIAWVYSGDAAYILSENKNMAYWAPNEGTNVWYDSMVIPVDAENPELANKFINYVMGYEAALDNTKAVGYTSPNAKAYAEMIKIGGEYEYNDAYKPRTNYAKDEIFHDNDVMRESISDKWARVKSAN